jgi:hypothetical protein
MTATERRESARREAERYRAAAEETLNQLDWCIAYLHRIRKPKIAAALARNRSEIRRRMR